MRLHRETLLQDVATKAIVKFKIKRTISVCEVSKLFITFINKKCKQVFLFVFIIHYTFIRCSKSKSNA